MNRAFLSLGGNLGDRLENIKKMREAISKKCGAITKMSRVFETEAWGHASNRPYLNQVIELNTSLSPKALLKATSGIEKKMGRSRGNERYQDRTADIDILFFNDLIVQTKELTLPHPRLHLRNFVLIPLEEIASKHVHPVFKKTVAGLKKQTKDKLKVTPFAQGRYIAIEGNIGSGKTTLAETLMKKYKARLIPELFEENSLLPLFYEYPDLYSFPLEYSFLISRFQQLNEHLRDKEGLIISDFSIYKSLWFAAVNLREKEFKLFKKHFEAFTRQLPGPDLIIVLKTRKDNLVRNIRKRGRPYEQAITKAYLEKLNQAYTKGLRKLEDIPQLEITVDTYDKAQEERSLKLIENYIKENFGEEI